MPKRNNLALIDQGHVINLFFIWKCLVRLCSSHRKAWTFFIIFMFNDTVKILNTVKWFLSKQRYYKKWWLMSKLPRENKKVLKGIFDRKWMQDSNELDGHELALNFFFLAFPNRHWPACKALIPFLRYCGVLRKMLNAVLPPLEILYERMS